MKSKAFQIILLSACLIFTDAAHSHAVSLDMETEMAALRPGSSFTIDIIINDPAGFSGSIFSLTYPAEIFFLQNTPISSTFFDSPLPFDGKGNNTTSCWAVNTDQAGVVYFAGISLDTVDPQAECHLFSVHFRVSDNASVGAHVIRLNQTNLCNGPAGWGEDRNRNGKYDDGDTCEKAPVLYSIDVHTANGWQVDMVESQTEVLADTLDPAPELAIYVVPSSGDDGILVGPANGDINVSLRPDFEVKPYPNLDNVGANAAIIWQISKNSSFTDIVYQMIGAPDQARFRLPDFILDKDINYSWRILYGNGFQQAGAWDAVGGFTTGPDHMIDMDKNGIPDDQDIGAGDNLIVQNHPGIDVSDLMVVKTLSGDFLYGLKPGNNVIGIDRLKWVDVDEIAESEQCPVNLPFGLLTFRLTTSAPGATVTINVYFSEPLQAWSEWWKYDPENGFYDYSQYITFADNMMSAVITLTDGGAGDADGVANGVIVDPGGIVKYEGSDSSGCLINTCVPSDQKL